MDASLTPSAAILKAALERGLQALGRVGSASLRTSGKIGHLALFSGRAVQEIGRRPLRLHEVAREVHFIGNRSLWIILLTSSFTGMVLVLQGYSALARFGSVAYLGPLVALSLVRELGPVLAALMVTARIGSSITAMLATMRITEQIDAVEAIGVSSLSYLVKPRLIATVIAVPLLTTFFDLFGLGAGYVFATRVLGVDGGVFLTNSFDAVEWHDVAVGFAKSVTFGTLLAIVATHRGYFADGGIAGVGRATAASVVSIATLILASDYLVSALAF